MSRQYEFILRFMSSFTADSPRKIVFKHLWDSQIDFLRHYRNLITQHQSKREIREHFKSMTINKVNNLAIDDRHYKYFIYKKFNPNLSKLNLTLSYSNKFLRLRHGSHEMPIEKGRYSRIPRKYRTCHRCCVLGDELHYIYSYPLIDRSKLVDIPPIVNLHRYEKLQLLLHKLYKYL